VSEPYFPPPKKTDPYREPAPTPIAAKPPAPVVVRRPEPPPSSVDERKKGRPPPLIPSSVFAGQRWYGDESLFARYPRPFAFMIFALFGSILWSNIEVLLHGGLYGSITSLFSPAGTLLGLWVLITGRPMDGNDTAHWWQRGTIIVGGIGVFLGVALRLALAYG
jgi:hypothetical protein